MSSRPKQDLSQKKSKIRFQILHLKMYCWPSAQTLPSPQPHNSLRHWKSSMSGLTWSRATQETRLWGLLQAVQHTECCIAHSGCCSSSRVAQPNIQVDSSAWYSEGYLLSAAVWVWQPLPQTLHGQSCGKVFSPESDSGTRIRSSFTLLRFKTTKSIFKVRFIPFNYTLLNTIY